MNKKKSNFSGQLGFVLAAAGSAVGVGNLWRFPYLAAKDGGGLFLSVRGGPVCAGVHQPGSERQPVLSHLSGTGFNIWIHTAGI